MEEQRERAHDSGLVERIARLGGVPLSAHTLESILGHVARQACASVPGCDHAGVSLVRDDKATTSAATDEEVFAADLAQYETGQGPCLDAARDQRVYVIEEMADETRWPQFAKRACALGIRSSASLPLQVEGEPLGALNLYAARERAFDEPAVETAQALTDAAGMLLDNAQSHRQALDLAGQLQEAMRSRAVIEQAKGMLIARHGYTPDQAFDALTKASQRSNRKLREVALALVDRSIFPH